MDLTSIQTINYIKNKYGFRMSKGLGQNFLRDPNVLDEIVYAAGLTKETGVLEIGPGIGVLTARLAEASKRAVAIEIDTRLLDVLDETLAAYDNIKIIHADVMRTDLSDVIATEFAACSSVSIAANLPYYITTPILTRLLEDSSLQVKNIVVMVQKEVADRMQVGPGTKDYGALSLAVQYYAAPEIVAIVPPNCFMPRPKVGSAVIRLTRHKEPPVQVAGEKLMFRIIRASFNQRRKTLANGLKNSGELTLSKEVIEESITELGVPVTIRGEALSLAQFAELSNIILKKM